MSLREERQGDYEIASDGRTVWLNRLTIDPRCVGRFHRFGFDVLESVAPLSPVPIDLRARTRSGDWRRFQRLMQRHYAVTISDDHRPAHVG